MGDASNSMRRYLIPIAFLALLYAFYVFIAWMVSGGDAWWHLDIVAGTNVYWGDDAYRYFLSRSAWQGLELYTFNFVLPVPLLVDGIITTLADGNLFLARSGHAVLAVLSVWAVYRSCRLLSISTLAAFMAAASLALMPLYIFLSLSFYGEAILVPGIALAIWNYTAGRKITAAWLVSLLPLARPEGIYFVMTFFVLGLLRRQWSICAIVVIPGILYLGFLLGFMDDPYRFIEWRIDSMKAYAKHEFWYKGALGRAADIFSWIWIAISIVGALTFQGKRLWPFWTAIIMPVVTFVGGLIGERIFFEPRYLVLVVPVACVLFGCGLETIRKWLLFYFGRRLCTQLLVISALFIILSHIMQVHVFQKLVDFYVKNRSLPTEVYEQPLMEALFRKMDSEEIDDYREAAELAEKLAKRNPEIDYIAAGNIHSLYFLDPREIPAHVATGFPIFRWGALGKTFGGDVPMYFPESPFFARFRLKPPEEKAHRILVIENIGYESYPYRWLRGKQEIYIFGYDFFESMPN